MSLSELDMNALRDAKLRLESPSLAIKISNLIGTPLEKGLALLPPGWSDNVAEATQVALLKGIQLVTTTFEETGPVAASNWLHKVLATTSGAAGGAFGLAALPLELPVSTGVMLRSIADVARSEGEPLRSAETKLACLEVFALGGKSSADDGADTGYFAVRAALAQAVAKAAEHIAKGGVVDATAPAIARLVVQLGARFGVTVSNKVAAQAIPILGAVAGATVNYVFIDHFQDMARGHFVVRRLERTYGAALIRAQYDAARV